MRLGDVIEQIRGVSYKPSDLNDNLSDDSVVLLRANNIQDGKIVLDDVVYVSKSKVSESQFLRQGDILVCTSSGSKELVGKAALIGEDLPMVFGAFCKVVRPKIECCKYMGHFFQSPYYRKHISEVSAGANINNLRNEHIADLHFPLPPLEEQRRIAAVLDKVSDLIAKRRTQLNKLDELVKSRFIEMFGDIHQSRVFPYLSIKDFTNVISGGTPDRNIAQYWSNGKIKWVKTTELKNKIIEDTEEKITKEGLKNSSAKIVPANTILIAMYGQGKTRGMTGCLSVEATTNQACACILPSPKVNPQYLWHYMMMSYEKLRNLAKGGNQPNLNGAMIKNFPVLMPPIELQNQFADFVKQTDKSKLAIQKNLEKLETLKKALMQEYFG